MIRDRQKILESQRRRYARRRPKQLALYRAYKRAGVCWRCKTNDIHNPNGAWCLKCMEETRIRRKS